LGNKASYLNQAQIASTTHRRLLYDARLQPKIAKTVP